MTPPTPHQYPAYKPSGVPWLGDLPEHWDVIPTRALLNLKKQLVGDRADKYTLLSLTKQGIIARDMENPEGKFPASFETYQVVEPGDLVFCLFDIDETPRTIGLSSMTGMITGAYTRFVCPNEQNRRFIYQLYLSLDNGKLLKPLYSGLRKVITKSTFLSATIPLPPLPEQRAIVRYLDHVDRRISRYVSAKRKLIALLEEEKQAVINQAVTRGLDPNVRLKPSGVEWLGDVPEHWEVVRNGQLFVQRNEKGFPELPILEVSLRTGVDLRDFENSDRKQMMAVRGEYKRAVKGDIAYNMMRMWQGAIGVAPVDGLVSPAYVVAKPLRGNDPRYFSALFRTSAYMAEVDKYSRGIVKDRNRLYWEDFKQMPTPCPPLHEQVLIADAIDQGLATLNDGANHTRRRQIELLQEYRTRLIADVVTGKLDVREAAAQLPDEGRRPGPDRGERPTGGRPGRSPL